MLDQHSFSVRLDFFSGPMDLLLHLVEQQEVSVAEVDMSAIAQQYLNVVASAEYIDLEQAAEYLVIAATLTAIKSHRLLPAEQGLEPGLDGFDGSNSEEFYEELRRRLREYELTKRRAVALANTPQHGIDSFSRTGMSLSDRETLIDPVDFQISKGDHLSLGKLFYKVLNRIGALSSSFRIKIDPVSIVSFMMKTIDSLSESVNRQTRFSTLIRRFSLKTSGPAAGASGEIGSIDKNTVIGSFIAILELMKRGVIGAYQPSPSSDIEIDLIMSAAGDIPSGTLESEFDQAGDAVSSGIGSIAGGEGRAGLEENSPSAAGESGPNLVTKLVPEQNCDDEIEPEIRRAVGS